MDSGKIRSTTLTGNTPTMCGNCSRWYRREYTEEAGTEAIVCRQMVLPHLQIASADALTFFKSNSKSHLVRGIALLLYATTIMIIRRCNMDNWKWRHCIILERPTVPRRPSAEALAAKKLTKLKERSSCISVWSLRASLVQCTRLEYFHATLRVCVLSFTRLHVSGTYN